MHIIDGELDDPRVQALLRAHLDAARAHTGHGSAHALDLSGLRAPDVRFWTIRAGDALVGMGALRRLDPRHGADHGEVKSMYCAASARRTGAGSAMLRHIVASAQAGGMTRLSLETGAWDYFRPARAFYRHHGFVDCAPFGDHAPDPNSRFITRALSAPLSPPG